MSCSSLALTDPAVAAERTSGARARDVPAFTVSTLAPRRHRYCVCIFVLNEGKKIIAQLERMRGLSDTVDIVIADGGSIDGALALDRLESAGVTALLVKTGPGRLSAQMRMALAYALDQGY